MMESEDEKKASNIFMTKYEEQKLLFDLLKKKKAANVKKVKLKNEFSLSSSEDERKNAESEIN